MASLHTNNGSYNTAKCAEAATAGELLAEKGGTASLDAGGHLFYDKDDDINRAEYYGEIMLITTKERSVFSFLVRERRYQSHPELVDLSLWQIGYPIGAEETVRPCQSLCRKRFLLGGIYPV